MKSISRRTFLKRSLLGLLVLALADAFWFETNFIEWKRHVMSFTGKGIRALQISDLHLQNVGRLHNNMLKKINDHPPDLLLLTGDVIDKAANLDALEVFLKGLDFSIPKFAILGNWEYWGKVDIQKLRTLYSQYNCQLLVNENSTISIDGTSISIVGVDDYVGGFADFEKAMNGVAQSDCCLVLNHCPAYRDTIAQSTSSSQIDLMLSGHTHGGQVSIWGWAPVRPPGSGRYVKGWYKANGPLTYVSKGVGTSLLPIRFGARAEIAEFVL